MAYRTRVACGVREKREAEVYVVSLPWPWAMCESAESRESRVGTEKET